MPFKYKTILYLDKDKEQETYLENSQFWSGVTVTFNPTFLTFFKETGRSIFICFWIGIIKVSATGS